MILKLNKEKVHCLTVPEIEERLKKSGVAATAQRIAICKFVLCEADHPTAEDIKNWTDANFPKLSRATVYNTLDVLVQAGMLKELKLPHTGKVVYDTNVGDHYHFLDNTSGKLFDISNEECKVILNLPEDIYIEEVDVFLRGKVSSV
ncbi:Fur family transcriptional regulator [Silvanigrella sp.]|jgi:Fur family iron response transcriptional regulator|uniref:Fur family transcriptional regulator n=1 Tax=Silvanigrella sp. TaxID=2024976 RepID=UPI0037CC1669